MAFAVVQHNLGIHNSTVPGAITLSSAPTSGNLLIALIGSNITFGSIAIGAGWTLFDCVQGGGINQSDTVVMTAMYRYVQPGDTATLPAFWSAGSTYWTHMVWEISGPLSGTWNSDFLCSVPMWNSFSNGNIPQFPVFADGIALSGTASYNGSTNPTVSGSWTRDDAANNNANYGSAAGAHRIVANGDTIDGAWTQGTSSPYGGIMLILTSLQPTGGVYPRHIATAFASGTPGSITVPWTPKSGSLLLAYLAWSNGTQPNPTITGSWTDFKDATITTKSMLGLYRYVQPGDTSALPAIASAGSTNYAVTFIELAGGSGTFGTDHVSDKAGAQASGASLATAVDTTTANNQFALLVYGNYNGNGFVSQSGFTNTFGNDVAFLSYGTSMSAFEFFPTSGSNVQATVTPNSTTNAQSYIQSIFNQGTGSISDSVNLSAATASGTAAGATADSSSGALGTAASNGAVGAAIGQIAVTPQPAAASGAGAAVFAGQGTSPSGIGTSGVAAAATAEVLITLGPALAVGVAVGISSSQATFISDVFAAGAAAAVAPAQTVRLAPAIASPAAAPITFGQQIPFPLFSIMRDAPVACVGTILDTPIALVGRMPPSGPEPFGVEVFLAAVSVTAHAATITPTFDVKVPLAAAIATGTAAPVVAA